MRKYLVILLLLIAIPCWGANHYINDHGQTYSGDGTTWGDAASAGGTGAWKNLPLNLVRDDVYYVGDGVYDQKAAWTLKAYRVNTPLDGDKKIYIYKATVDDHGTETGWDNAYGDGQAILETSEAYTGLIGPLYIIYGNVVIDGKVGSGSDSSTYGFVLRPTPSTCGSFYKEYLLRIQKDTSNIKISHVAFLSCGPDYYPTTSTPANYTQVGLYHITINAYGSKNIEVSNNYFSKMINPIQVRNWDESSVHDNYFAGNIICTAPADCAHGNTMTTGGMRDWHIYNNTFTNVYDFIVGNHTSGGEPVTLRLKFYNNLIIGNETYGQGYAVAQAESARADGVWQAELHHNTYVDVNFSNRGPLTPCIVTDVATNHSHAYNNIFYNCNTPRLDNLGTAYAENAVVHDNNAYLKCTGTINSADEAAPQRDDTSESPFNTGLYTISTTWDAAQVSAEKASLIGKGKTLASPFDIDILGVTRTAPFDIGAYDVGGEADAAAPTLAEVTPVSTPSPNQAPSYVFSSDEAGTVTYGGTCGNGSLSTAIVGNNTTSWALGIATYSDCTITVTDAASNASTPLAVQEFVITPVDSAAAKTIEGGVSFQSLP